MCGPEDRHEAPGTAGATRGAGLPPADDRYPEGVRQEGGGGGREDGMAVGGEKEHTQFLLVLIRIHTI